MGSIGEEGTSLGTELLPAEPSRVPLEALRAGRDGIGGLDMNCFHFGCNVSAFESVSD